MQKGELVIRIYCFTTSDGLTVEQSFPMGEAPQQVKLLNGQAAYRDLAAELSTMTVAIPVRHQAAKGWPMSPCVGSGVHPSQAQELRDHLEDRGCKTEITNDGDPIYTSVAHRKKALKIRGMHDRNSFD